MTRKPPAARPPKPVTPQKVRAVLRKAGLTAAKWHRSGLVRGWGSWSDGYLVASAPTWREKEIKVDHIFSEGRCRVLPETIDRELARIALALTAAGIACEVREGAVWVAVEQGQSEDDR